MLLAALLLPWATSAQTTNATVPYSTGFEVDDDVAWTLINVSTSTHALWYIGTAAHNTGSKGLYVSNDGGSTNTYANNSTVNWAVRRFTLAAGQYAISFDWRCKGESTYDYLRCFLVPGDVSLTAGTTLPTGVTATGTPAGWQDLGGKMNLQDTWQNSTSVFTIATAGTYQIAFMWRNDVSTANQPPAAVDNVQVAQLTCPKPDSLQVTGITSTSATFSWQAGGTETAWEIRINNGEWVSATSPVTIDTFMVNTPYVFGVRAVCSDDDVSYVTSTTFRTNCATLTTGDLPYTYDFEDATGNGAAYEIDQCWGRHYSSGSTRYPNPSTTYAHSGTYSLYMFNNTSVKSWVTLPEIDASVDVSTLSVNFWAYKASANYGHLKVGVMTDPNNIATFTPVQSLWVDQLSTWKQYEISLDEYTGTGRYVAIMADSNALNHSYIDDVTLMVTPSCAAPEAVSAANLMPTSFTLNITDPTNVGQYLVEFSGDTVFSETLYSNSGSFYDIEPNISLTVNVYSVCTDGTLTAPVTIMLHTPCSPYPASMLPLTEDFDSYTGGTSAAATNRLEIDCWSVNNRYLANYPYYSTSQHNSGSNSLYFYTSAAQPTVVALPLFETPVSQLELGMWVRVATANYSVEVGYMSNPDDVSSFVVVDTAAPSAINTWEEFIIDFPANATGFIAFRKGNGTTAYIDDISVRLAPSCARMQGFTVSDVTSDGATITINDAAHVDNYVINAINGDDTVHFSTSMSPYTLTGLTPNTPYLLEVYTLCEDGTTTAPRYQSFRTDCAPISQLPWSEGFENYDASTVPFCWLTVSGNNKVMGTASNVHNGTKYLDFRGTTTGNIMVFPEVSSDIALSTLSVHFFTRPESTNSSCGYFTVGYYTANELGDTVFVVLDSMNVADFSTATYREVDIPLTGVPDDSRLAFRHMANSTIYYWYVDDVSLYVTPSCPRAQGIGIANLSDSTVNVIIDDSNHVDNYVVKLIVGHDTVEQTAYDTIVPFGNLLPDTLYKVEMVTDCGDGYTLPFTYTFTTPCVGIDSLPWSENFNSYTGATSASATSRMDIPCWTFPYRSSANYPYFYNSSTYVTDGGNCVCTNTGTVIVLPQFAYAPQELMMEFDVRVATAGFGFEVGVMADPNNTATFVPVASCIPDTISAWRHYSVTFAGKESGFLALRTSGTTAYFDNVSVDLLPECAAPSQLIVENIDSVSATVNIADANATGRYRIYTSENDSLGVEVNDYSYHMTGLTPNTSYTIRVKTVCADGTMTEPAEVSFRTMCTSRLPLPYYENFDDLAELAHGDATNMEGGAPPCWDVLGHSGSMICLYSSTSYRYGDSGYSLKFKSGSNNVSNYLILPLFEQPISDLEITFQTRPEGTSASSGTFEIGYMTDPAEDSTFVVVDHYVYSEFNGAYQLKDALFTGAPADARIAMRHTPTGMGWFWFVDEIDVHQAPACKRPGGVFVDNIVGNSVTVHIVDSSAAMHYYCCFDNGVVVDTIEVFDTVAVINTLSPAVTYTLRVYTVCAEESSVRCAQTTFVTGCGAISLPVAFDPQNYATGTSAPLPPCWKRLNNATVSTNYYPYIYSSASYAHSGTNVLYYSFATTSGYATEEIMVFPEIDTLNFPMNQIDVSFWAKSSVKNRKLVVGVLSNPDSMSSFQPIDTIRLTTTVTQYIVETGAFIGNGAYIGLKGFKDTTSAFYVYVDDIKFEVGSPCARSRNIQAANATSTTVEIGWTDVVTDYNQWKIRYTQDTLDSWTEVTANSNPFVLTGLTPNTIYRAVVAPVCSDGTTAFASRDTVRFNTSQVPAIAPYSYDFEDAAEWANWQTASNNNTRWYRGIMPNGDTTNTMYLSADSGATNSWTRTVVTNVAAYRDIDFGPVPSNYDLTFRYSGGGHHTSVSDGISVMLLDPVTPVETIPSTYLGSPWGNIHWVHAHHDTTWNVHTVHFDGVSGVRRMIFYHFNNALTDSTLFLNVAPAIDDIHVFVPACERPSGLEVIDVTPTTATIQWEGDDSATYRIDYRLADTTGGDLFDTVVGLTHTITGLASHTTYNVWVKKLCNDSLQSSWSANETFTTLCGYESLPFNEDFESYTGSTYNTAGVLPTCWEGYSNGTSDLYQPHITGSGSYCYPHSGTKALTLTSGGATFGDTKVVALPPFNAPMSSLKMSFWYRTESTSYGTLTVGYVTSLEDLAGSYQIVATLPNTTTIVNDTVDFSNVPDSALQMAFRWVVTGSSTNWNTGIDDINVWYEEDPTCMAPVVIDTTVGENTVTVVWTNTSTSYEVAIMENAWEDSLAVATVVTDTAKTFTGLTASTQYVIGVRAICAADIVSEWVLTTIITDDHPCYAPTGLTITNITFDGGSIGWVVGEQGQTAFQVNLHNSTLDSNILVNDATTLTLTGLYSGTDYEIKVRAVCGTDNYSDWSNMVTLTPISCDAPTNVQAPNVTATTAIITWAGTASQYEVRYGVDISTSTGDVVVVENTTTASLTGLDPETEYDVYVRAICAEGVSSDWTAKFQFTTSASSGVTYTVTLTKNDNNGGTVEGAGTYEQGATATIKAIPAEGYYFAKWSDNDTHSVRQIVVNSDIDLMAYFYELGGIDDVYGSEVVLYPNPASTQVTLAGLETGATVNVVDLNGRSCGQWLATGESMTIDLTGYAQGAYFVRIVGEQGTAVRKLIVK